MASLTILICVAKYKCKALCSICVFLYPNSLNVIFILRFTLVISNLIWRRLIYKWVSIFYTSIKCNFLRVQFCCREMMAKIRSIQIFPRSHWLCSSGAYDAVSKIHCLIRHRRINPMLLNAAICLIYATAFYNGFVPGNCCEWHELTAW